jgi:hypothetical protein
MLPVPTDNNPTFIKRRRRLKWPNNKDTLLKTQQPGLLTRKAINLKKTNNKEASSTC